MLIQIDVAVDGNRRALVSTETTSEAKNMPALYKIFSGMAQLGGFHACLVVVLGFLIQPIYDKCLRHRTLNALNRYKSKYLMRLRRRTLKKLAAQPPLSEVAPNINVKDLSNHTKENVKVKEEEEQKEQNNGEGLNRISTFGRPALSKNIH